MYVRLKRIGSNRYGYLVRGVSKNGRVMQKTLAYLGPMTRIAMGVPEPTRQKIEKRLGTLDWNEINSDIRRIPITFEEMQKIKCAQLPSVLRIRATTRNRNRGTKPRTEGELAALTIIAKKRFDALFETIGERRYRMRL